jgi:hypothetical protein
MKLEKKIYFTRREKTTDFIIGVAIFFGLNILLTGLNFLWIWATNSIFQNNEELSAFFSLVSIAITCLPWIVNIAMIILLALTRPWIAIGMLGAIALLFALALILTVIAFVACLVILGMSGQGL